jgi:hypothetical protein
VKGLGVGGGGEARHSQHAALARLTHDRCKEAIIIIIITIIIISFMQGIYTYIPETNYVPRECSVFILYFIYYYYYHH